MNKPVFRIKFNGHPFVEFIPMDALAIGLYIRRFALFNLESKDPVEHYALDKI